MTVNVTASGRTGLSAYELWLAAGNTGSLSDFIATAGANLAPQVAEAKAWAQSPTAPDPLDPASKSSKTIAVELNAAYSQDVADLDAQFPNLFYPEEIDCTQPVRLRPGFGLTNLPAATYLQNGSLRPARLITAAAGQTEQGAYLGPFFRAEFGSQTVMSFGLQIFSLTAFTGTGSNTQLRVMIIQIDSSGAEISGTRREVQVRTTAGVSSPEWVPNLNNIPIHDNMHRVVQFVGLSNVGGTASRSVLFGDYYARPGNFSRYSRPKPRLGNGGVVYISPTGSDSAGLGTEASPYATLQFAINAINAVTKNGVIYCAPGSYGSTFVDATTIKGKIEIVGQRRIAAELANPPLFIGASKISGVTKTSGRTKVYQATVAGLPDISDFNWAYQDGIADPRSVIPYDERDPRQDGRTNRLHRFTKLVKTTATTLSAALSEIDSSDPNDPKAFIADGILYFSIVGGGDGAAANIYLDGPGLFTNTGGIAGSGMVTIRDIEFRYGGLNLRAFRHATLEKVVVHGASGDGIQFSNLLFFNIEVAAAGSQAGATGDGLNGHYGANVNGKGGYFHDCRDDGISPHEFCFMDLSNILVEWNGGTGIAIAYGAGSVVTHVLSQCNVRRGVGHKPAGIAILGDPTATTPADGGVDTRGRVEDCESYKEPVGFHDDGGATSPIIRAYGVFVRCVAREYTMWGFNVDTLLDCRYTSTAGLPAIKPGRGTTIISTSLITS